jgi:hypothetical protein
VFSATCLALLEVHEPLETAIYEAAEEFGPNLDQGFRGFPMRISLIPSMGKSRVTFRFTTKEKYLTDR